MGRSISGVIATKRLKDVRLFDALVQALKAAALVGVLVLAWTMPTAAHPGHGASSKSTVLAASSPKHAVQQVPAAASLSNDNASVYSVARSDMSVPSDDPQRDGGLGRVCCGTMCMVAAIEQSATSLPLRTSHRLRRYLPPETPPHTGTPNLPARPPRTSNIA